MLLFSCSSQEKNVEPQVTFAAGTDKNPVIDAAGGTVSISFTVTDAWTATVSKNPDWLSVSPESGAKGEAGVKISAEPNDEPYSRAATVMIKCGTAVGIINVTQKAADASLEVSPREIELQCEGGSFAIEVTHNIDVDIYFSDNSGWILKEEVKYGEKDIYAFKVGPNEAYRTREADISFKSEEFGVDATVHVVQLAKEYDLTPICSGIEGLEWRMDEAEDQTVFSKKAMSHFSFAFVRPSSNSVLRFTHEYTNAWEQMGDISEGEELSFTIFQNIDDVNEPLIRGVILKAEKIDGPYVKLISPHGKGVYAIIRFR